MYAGFPTMAYLTPKGSVVDVVEAIDPTSRSGPI